MGSELRLTVNGISIETLNFVKDFTENTVIGMMGGLKDIGTVGELEMNLRSSCIDLAVNGRPIPLNDFANRIIISTIEGLLQPMRGVTFPIKTIELYIKK
jgi:hypothetical protein